VGLVIIHSRIKCRYPFQNRKIKGTMILGKNKDAESQMPLPIFQFAVPSVFKLFPRFLFKTFCFVTPPYITSSGHILSQHTHTHTSRNITSNIHGKYSVTNPTRMRSGDVWFIATYPSLIQGTAARETGENTFTYLKQEEEEMVSINCYAHS
jgi:hypothetical protein